MNKIIDKDMKPEVICHIMSSVDGRLIDSRWSDTYEGSHIDALKEYVAAGRELDTDAWMFGKNTLRSFFPEKFESSAAVITADEPRVYKGDRTSARMFVVADDEGDIRFMSSTVRGDNILVIVGSNVTEDYLSHLREQGISYVIVERATNLAEGLEAIGREFGIRRISVQGGGIINGALLAAGVIDELSLVVYPGIDGLSGVPSIFEYIGGDTAHPAQGQRLQLLSATQRDFGVVWLRYRFRRD